LQDASGGVELSLLICDLESDDNVTMKIRDDGEHTRGHTEFDEDSH
jgi:hypothetical protein